MEQFVPYAPAHNPVYLELMRNLRERYPALCQAVRFETSFHADIPAFRTAYGIPWQWAEEWGIRRYGFHGSSHEYIAGRMQELEPDAKRVISIHLGGSSSLCAIRDGKSIASSMGATPQTGLFQNNRVGDFDVCCLPELVRRCGSLERDVYKRQGWRRSGPGKSSRETRWFYAIWVSRADSERPPSPFRKS